MAKAVADAAFGPKPGVVDPFMIRVDCGKLTEARDIVEVRAKCARVALWATKREHSRTDCETRVADASSCSMRWKRPTRISGKACLRSLTKES